MGMKWHERSDFLMGTVISQKIWGQNKAELLEVCYKDLVQLEKRLSSYREDSEVSRINAVAGRGSVVVDDSTLEVIELGLRYGELSNGSFDITMGPLIKAWGILSNHEVIPPLEMLKELGKLVDYKSVRVDRENQQIGLRHLGQMLDLGGIAKGYICDRIMSIYRTDGVTSAMINMGGNVAVMGGKPDGTPWHVGIQNPNSPEGNILGTVSIREGSVVTSGGYQRYFEKDGKWYHHILNPVTGYPANTDLLSATIVAPKSADAEGLSTPVFMAGSSGAAELLAKIPGAEAVLIDQNMRVLVTEGLKNDFTLNHR